jgi:hypothetical protein
MGRYLLVAAALLAASACKKDKSEGLPPAQEWSANANALEPAPQPGNPVQQGPNPHAGMDMNNPHAGMDMNNPRAGMDMNNPHAGMDMNDPHAGIDMNNPHGGGTDVTKLGLAAPDPDRPIDPKSRVAGTIKVHPKAAARVAEGGTVYISIKQAGPDGAPNGMPLAVDKLAWAKDGIKFELSSAKQMVGGTPEGVSDVVVTAHYDLDGDPISKSPGDVIGSARVKVPADIVNILLDDVVN